MVLLLSDFPEGWRASASENDESSQEKFRKCLGVDYSGSTKIGEADSKDFAIEDTTEASSSSQIYEDAQQASDAVEELASGMEGPNAERCFKELAEETLSGNDTKDVSIDNVDIGELNVQAPESVEETRAWQVVITFTVKAGDGELSPSAYIDLTTLRQGEAISELRTSDVLSPFDSDLRNQLVETLASRMTPFPANE
jgi:hypothetical protein